MVKLEITLFKIWLKENIRSFKDLYLSSKSLIFIKKIRKQLQSVQTQFRKLRAVKRVVILPKWRYFLSHVQVKYQSFSDAVEKLYLHSSFQDELNIEREILHAINHVKNIGKKQTTFTRIYSIMKKTHKNLT